MDDINAIDTNSILLDKDHYKNLSWKRCPKRPRRNVYNNAFCGYYENNNTSDLKCKHELTQLRIDGYTYCGNPIFNGIGGKAG